MPLLDKIRSWIHDLTTPIGVEAKSYERLFNRPGLVDGRTTETLTSPYQQSIWIQSAIQKIVQPILSAPLRFSSDGPGGEQVIEDAAIDAYWQRPALHHTWAETLTASIGNFLLCGEFFWIFGDDALAPFPEAKKQPSRFTLAAPDTMREIEDNDGNLAGWRYTSRRGKTFNLLPEQVIQIKRWNPNNPLRGLGVLDAIRADAEADWHGTRYQRNLMANAGDQGVYIVAKNGIPSDQQRAQILRDLRAKREAQQRGEFRAVFLTGDMTIESPELLLPDESFLRARLQNRHAVYIAFGVPASMADITVAYSIGSASDQYHLIANTSLPISTQIISAIDAANRILLRKENLFAWLDWDNHPVMQAVRRERIKEADSLWAKGMPMKEVSAYLDLGIPEYPGWDVGYLPMGVTSTEEFSEQDASPPRESQDEAEENYGKASNTQHNCASASKAVSRLLEAVESRASSAWSKHWRRRQTGIKTYRRGYRSALFRARAETLANLQRVTRSKAPHNKAAAADIIFNLPNYTATLQARMRASAAAALQSAGDQIADELNLDDAYKFPPEEVLTYHRTRENKITGAAEEDFRRINETIEEGLVNGETQAQLATRIRSAFNGLSQEHAETIALTETAAAYGLGRQKAMSEAGIAYKKWLTSGNDNVRAAHRAAEGQARAIDEPYEVGGEELMHPGDPSGSAENVINCHCVSIPITEEEYLRLNP